MANKGALTKTSRSLLNNFFGQLRDFPPGNPNNQALESLSEPLDKLSQTVDGEYAHPDIISRIEEASDNVSTVLRRIENGDTWQIRDTKLLRQARKFLKEAIAIDDGLKNIPKTKNKDAQDIKVDQTDN